MEFSGPGRRKERVTLAEIAKTAGVSKSTASLVLNDSSNLIPISDATRKKVLDTAKRLGYRPNAAARSLVTGRSQTILMVVVGSRDSHLVARIQGAESYLTPLRYPLHMCTVDAGVGLKAYQEVMRAGRADGVLLTGIATADTHAMVQEMCGEAREMGKPVVAIANAFPSNCTGAVAQVEDQAGAEQATSHLIAHGHRRIALIGVSDQPWAQDRIRGYRTAHEKAGIPVDSVLMALGKFDEGILPWVFDAARRLAMSEKFTAAFVMTDALALAAMSALKSAGKRIPQDCAVVGYDDDEVLAHYSDPPLTTVHNPFYEQGEAAAKMLVALIEEKPLDPVLLPVSLVVRKSCGCPEIELRVASCELRE